MNKETLLLENLNCPSCAADLERTLKQMPGVKHAKIAFATGTLEIDYDASQVSDETIAKTVSAFGVAVAAKM